MTSVTLVVRTILPALPVTVSVYEPVGEFLLVLIVSTELPEPEIVDGLNLPVTDLGRPLTDSLIPTPDVAETL
jgi:hypothetical protein